MRSQCAIESAFLDGATGAGRPRAGLRAVSRAAPGRADVSAVSAHRLYSDLSGVADGADDQALHHFLEAQLARASALPCDLPEQARDLDGWVAHNRDDVAARYAAYLAERKAGSPRRYFSNRAHALYFLRCVAPTKLVDGAWLYGCLQHWQDSASFPLIKTYVEELGGGHPARNHVALFQRLIDHHGCGDWDGLDDSHFTQGAIQLALGYADGRYLPETVGFNLGYEQLPLHLLITSYELNELGIDPYYFTLHVTVDNPATGHAHDAIDAVRRLMALSPDPAEFYGRVRAGYRLNELGASTNSVIADFDLEAELVRVMVSKAAVGKDMHGDYCRIAGKTINAWLSDPAQVPGLLRAFENTGWVRRGAPAAESRFWRLLQSERADMVGVFSPYEQQVLADWIEAGDSAGAPRVVSFRARQRAAELMAAPREQAHRERALIRYAYAGTAGEHDAGDDQLRALEQAVALANTRAEAIAILIAQMSPARHHSAVGMMATRMFTRMIAQ
jgi:hypothetical protein